MQAPAHPDDETNALFAYFGYGMGLRVIDLQNNRGDGGQNEIGPELFRDMAVLRTSELLAAHRTDGAEQYFTRDRLRLLIRSGSHDSCGQLLLALVGRTQRSKPPTAIRIAE